MLYDKEKEIQKKYEDVLGSIVRSNLLHDTEKPTHPDIGTAYRMLCEMARTGDHGIYAGVPSDFDWDGFKNDAGI